MRTLIVTELITLDGVIDSPGGGDHPDAGWTFKDVAHDEAVYDIKAREQAEAGSMLLGRRTYTEMVAVWPTMTEFTAYNAMPKHVVSSTLIDPTWHDTTVLRDLDGVAALKQSAGGPIVVHGSATLAQGLAAAGLVDRYHLLVFPVLLGSGKRLFADDAPKQKLRLVEHAAYSNGVQLAVYDVE